MVADNERHGVGTNLRIAGYLACNALALICALGFVIALIYAVVQGAESGRWFSTRLADVLQIPSFGNATVDVAIDWTWKIWIGWPVFAIGALAAGLTIAFALSLGDER